MAKADGVYFSHIPSEDLIYGENIDWLKTSNPIPPTCTTIINIWYKERAKYNWNSPDGKGGHFSQLVWRNTMYFGCALVRSLGKNGGYFAVCNYTPYGNIKGKYMKNVFKPSQCHNVPDDKQFANKTRCKRESNYQ